MRSDQMVVVALRVVFLLYITLLLLHSALERRYARRSWRQRLAGSPATPGLVEWPTVDVVIPCFNENPRLLEACCRSVAAQDYQGSIRVWLVDDGFENQADLQPVYQRWADEGWRVRPLAANAGKRAAQDEGVREGGGELVVLMDSDTVLATDAVRQAAVCFRDERVGAVSGNVGVLNAAANLLTRLIHHRYRLRFQLERPAQGLFTSLLCCAGPFSVYRRSVLRDLWPRYLTQTFAGVRCTNGDDLHLTNLVLAAGRQVLFEPRAVASTSVPARFGCISASSCAGTGASTGSCAGRSPGSGPVIPTWSSTCWPGGCCRCCWPPPWCSWPPRGCWSAGSCWSPTSPWPWPCCW